MRCLASFALAAVGVILAACGGERRAKAGSGTAVQSAVVSFLFLEREHARSIELWADTTRAGPVFSVLGIRPSVLASLRVPAHGRHAASHHLRHDGDNLSRQSRRMGSVLPSLSGVEWTGGSLTGHVRRRLAGHRDCRTIVWRTLRRCLAARRRARRRRHVADTNDRIPADQVSVGRNDGARRAFVACSNA
jgi:hypothetical protein